MFLSANNGADWTTVNNGISATSVSSITFKDNNVFAGGYGGVYLSKDSGSSWSVMNNGLLDTSVIPITSSGSNVYAGTRNKGVFLSVDNGNNWVEANNGLSNQDILSFAVKEDSIFAGTGGSGVFMSTNYGTSWVAKNNGISNKHVLSIAFNGDSIFIGTTDGILLSTDSGDSWTDVSNGLANNTWVYAIAIVDNKFFAGTNYGGVYISTDNATSWTAVNNGITDLNIMSLAVIDNNIIAGTNGGGVFMSTNYGTSWIEINNGLLCKNVRSMLIAVEDIYVGTFGGGVWKRLLSDINFLNVSTTSLNIEAPANSTKTFDISSSIDWTAESNETWLTLDNTSGSNDATITLTAQANPTTSERIAAVKVSGTGVTSQTITVTQEAATITRVNEISKSKISVFPNPANTTIFFKGINQNSAISIFDCKGKLLVNNQIINDQIDISKLAYGIYTIMIVDKIGTTTRKFIKR